MNGHTRLGTADLEVFIRANSIRAEVVHLPVETPTVDLAAAAVGTSPEQIVKSLLFLVADEPLLVVARGRENVDRRAISRYLNVGRRRVSLARPEAVLGITGYPVGALPPFGHRSPVRTIVDRRVSELPLIFAGGGSTRALLRMDPTELLRVCGDEVVDVRQSGPSDEG